MKESIARYGARFDALSVRERLLVFIAVASVIGLVVYSALLDPLSREGRRLREHIGQQEPVLANTRTAVQSLLKNQSDPDAGLRAQRQSISRELAKIDAELESTQRGLVPPERMAALLESLVAGSQRLQIVALRSLAPTPLIEKPQAKPEAGAAAAATDEPGIFKHGIELKVEGSYGDLSSYVAKLERMPWRMYWARAALDANAYPRVGLTLTLYTLSLERSWLRL